MGLKDEVLLVREAIVGAVLAAWPDAKVTTEQPEMNPDLPFARIRLDRMSFDFESPLLDGVELCFEVLGRFAHGGGPIDDERLARAESLREELLALENAGGISFSGLVKEIRCRDIGPVDDDAYDLKADYCCRLTTGR